MPGKEKKRKRREKKRRREEERRDAVQRRHHRHHEEIDRHQTRARAGGRAGGRESIWHSNCDSNCNSNCNRTDASLRSASIRGYSCTIFELPHARVSFEMLWARRRDGETGKAAPKACMHGGVPSMHAWEYQAQKSTLAACRAGTTARCRGTRTS